MKHNLNVESTRNDIVVLNYDVALLLVRSSNCNVNFFSTHTGDCLEHEVSQGKALSRLQTTFKCIFQIQRN